MARSKFDGITEEKNAKGEKVIYVLFQFQGKRYPKKNFTKLFGCTTKEEASKRLMQVKLDISQNKDPFSVPKIILNDFFDEMARENLESGKWKANSHYWNILFYNKYLRSTIGHKKPSKITKDDLKNILTKNMKHLAEETKQQLRKILSPIFKEAIEQGLMFEDLSTSLPVVPRTLKEDLEVRSLDDVGVIVKKFYNTIPYYVAHKIHQRTEMINFYMFILMTGKRTGEVLKLKRENCYLDEKVCISTKTITKTEKSFKFPLPDEVIPFIESVKSGLLFPTIGKTTVGKTWEVLLRIARIRLVADKRITPHDTRRFILNIMIDELNVKESVADACIDHAQIGVIRHYRSIKYKEIEEAFFKYWEFLRDPGFEFEPLFEKKRHRTKAETKALLNLGWERYVKVADRLFPDNPHYRKTVEQDVI